MVRIQERTIAPDFSLVDTKGENFNRSAFQGDKHIVLVFNRGFT